MACAAFVQPRSWEPSVAMPRLHWRYLRAWARRTSPAPGSSWQIPAIAWSHWPRTCPTSTSVSWPRVRGTRRFPASATATPTSASSPWTARTRAAAWQATPGRRRRTGARTARPTARPLPSPPSGSLPTRQGSRTSTSSSASRSHSTRPYRTRDSRAAGAPASAPPSCAADPRTSPARPAPRQPQAQMHE